MSYAYDTVGGERDKESTAITITLPCALDRALQALADQKHCGNKSAAIREILYKEAGMQATFRLNEKKDNDSVTNAERRSGQIRLPQKEKKRKINFLPAIITSSARDLHLNTRIVQSVQEGHSMAGLPADLDTSPFSDTST